MKKGISQLPLKLRMATEVYVENTGWALRKAGSALEIGLGRSTRSIRDECKGEVIRSLES